VRVDFPEEELSGGTGMTGLDLPLKRFPGVGQHPGLNYIKPVDSENKNNHTNPCKEFMLQTMRSALLTVSKNEMYSTKC